MSCCCFPSFLHSILASIQNDGWEKRRHNKGNVNRHPKRRREVYGVNAAAFAQAGLDIPALGTTHADYFYGDIPCTRALTEEETKSAYEKNTGAVIIETVRCRGYEPLAVPGALVRNHGPFAWGKNAADAVYHAVVMETAAEMALKTKLLNPSASLPAYILDEHYQRKHGPNATYGQGK